MYSNFYNEKNEYFSIIAVSLLFHLSVVIALLIAVWLRPAKEKTPPIPFFEMVNVAPPPPAPSKPVNKPPPEPIHEPVAEPEPVIKPELKPEPKPTPIAKPEPKPEPKPKPATPTAPAEPTPAPSMDMPMDMPSDAKSKEMNMPALRTLGDVIMDPQLEAYLKTLVRLLFQNFNPPSGTEIAKGTKSSVQFQIARNGEIHEVVLRSSSGNSIWDRLAVRAVQITKPPPLPPSFIAENLPLIFDFREK
jgi:protein TonB